jgi:hypothetical protein
MSYPSGRLPVLEEIRGFCRVALAADHPTITALKVH